MRRRIRIRRTLASALRVGFWPVEEALVVAYLFVVMFGAVRPGEILPVTIAVTGLLLAWLAHAAAARDR